MERPELEGTVVVAGSHRLAAYLRAQASGREERGYPLFRGADVIVVGSDPECSWPVGDSRVAPRQVRLEWDGVLLRVEPLATDPPARLDGQPLPADKTLMRPHQRLSLGATTITLEFVFDSADGTVIVPDEPGLLDKTVVDPPREITQKIQRPLPQRVGRTPPGRRTRARYQPPRHAASAADPTRPWPLADAERPVADVFGRINRTNLRWLARRWRRQGWRPWLIALAGALVLLGALVTRRALAPKPRPAAHAPLPARPARAPAPIESATPAEPSVTVEESPGLMLRRAVEAYRGGRFKEARDAFSSLAEDTGDPAARLTVWIIDHRDPRDEP